MKAFIKWFSNKIMVAAMLFMTTVCVVRAQDKPQPIIGNWDLTVDKGNHEVVASWLEVKLSGFRTLVGYFVSSEGSARPVSVVKVNGNNISFSIPPQWEMGINDLVFEGILENDKLSGTITYPDGKKGTFKGERAPVLLYNEPAWGEPVSIFNGKNLDGWKTQRPENQWVVENGVLKSPKSGSNIITNQKFQDFKLHIEFRYPEGSNSGVYLRGRYELQIIDSKGQEPSSILFGGIYGFCTPNQDAALAAGEWQSYDITLFGRRITVVANGKTIICDQVIPGLTGAALDSKEGEPGPILLQGDHGPIEFRNITVAVPR